MNARVKDILDRLGASPPQVLLFEGGDSAGREEAALYWAARLNCASRAAACGSCPACVQIAAWRAAGETVLRDLFVFDGRAGHIKIDPIREIIPVFQQPPVGDGRRVVIFIEAQELTREAANTLLKSFEEPNPGTVFALTAPQRERLLPTLVSRSWVLTLGWPATRDASRDAGVREWVAGLAGFAATGRDWFSRTAGKGAVDKDTALAVVLACQRDLALALQGEPGPGPAGALWRSLGAEGLRQLDLALSHAQDALTLPTPVNPALVLDWLATRVRSWLAA